MRKILVRWHSGVIAMRWFFKASKFRGPKSRAKQRLRQVPDQSAWVFPCQDQEPQEDQEPWLTASYFFFDKSQDIEKVRTWDTWKSEVPGCLSSKPSRLLQKRKRRFFRLSRVFFLASEKKQNHATVLLIMRLKQLKLKGLWWSQWRGWWSWMELELCNVIETCWLDMHTWSLIIHACLFPLDLLLSEFFYCIYMWGESDPAESDRFQFWKWECLALKAWRHNFKISPALTFRSYHIID